MSDNRARGPVTSGPVLVVEDDPEMRHMLELLLTHGGYRVETTADGAEVLATVGRVPPAVILLDLRMPARDGWGFAEAYRAGFERRAPILVLTAGREGPRFATEIGAAGYLAKPFAVEELLRMVARLAAAGQAVGARVIP